MNEVGLKEVVLPYPVFSKGKVRDNYLYKGNLLLCASDRLSAFDVVFNEPIPKKGIVLNQLAVFWFKKFKDLKNHLLELPEEFVNKHSALAPRCMYVKKTFTIPIEAIVRGYLFGSAYKEYRENGTVCGIELPSNLKEGSKLPQPILTPTTKAKVGHDVSITHEQAREIVLHSVGEDIFGELTKTAIALYKKAYEYAYTKGIVIVDTKLEFGIDREGNLMIIDEIFTPDSSRFWPVEKMGDKVSLDKQFVRDYLEKTGWNKQPPAPELPKEVIEETSGRYIQVYEQLTGTKFIY